MRKRQNSFTHTSDQKDSQRTSAEAFVKPRQTPFIGAAITSRDRVTFKTKVIALTNQKGLRQYSEPIKAHVVEVKLSQMGCVVMENQLPSHRLNKKRSSVRNKKTNDNYFRLSKELTNRQDKKQEITCVAL